MTKAISNRPYYFIYIVVCFFNCIQLTSITQELNIYKLNFKIMTRYLFENDKEEWLTRDGKFTKDPNKAMKSKCEIEANLFLMGKNRKGIYTNLKVTEHEYVS